MNRIRGWLMALVREAVKVELDERDCRTYQAITDRLGQIAREDAERKPGAQ